MSTLAFVIPVEVVRYIQEYLCVCELCFHSEVKNKVNMCVECKRYWCHDCKPIPRLLRHVYDHCTRQKIHICMWCLRETRISLGR